MIEILTHVKKQDSYRIFVNLYYFALWSFFQSLLFSISFSNVLSQIGTFWADMFLSVFGGQSAKTIDYLFHTPAWDLFHHIEAFCLS